MGQSKGGGYKKFKTVTPEVSGLLKQLIGQAGPQLGEAAEGFRSFLPGGGGGQPIIDAANKNFQQQTIPSILNSFGTGSKGSSSLNQALAAGSSDLNTNIGSILAQMQLQASQGLGGLGLQQAALGAQTPQFGFMQRQQPFWQSALLGTLGVGGQLGGGYLGRPTTNFNFPSPGGTPVY